MRLETAISTAMLISSFTASMRSPKASYPSRPLIARSRHLSRRTFPSKAHGFVFPWTRSSEQPSLV